METSENLQPTLFEQTESELTQSAEAFRAKTSARQAKVRELKAKGLAYGLSTPALLANYDPKSSSWRTSQRCLVEGWTEFSETWPRSGMMRNGTAYQLPPLVRLTDATGCGLWQTPVADDAVNRKQGKVNSRGEPKLSAQVKMWPTPTAHNAKEGAFPAEYKRNTPTLSAEAGGKLNPTWVEWLMGFPTGHTDLKP